MASADQISCRNLGRRSGRRPLRKRHRQCQAAGHAEGAGSPINHPSQRRTAKRLRQRMRGNGWKLRQRSSPKYPATSDNPSVALQATAPFTQGSLRDEGAARRVVVPYERSTEVPAAGRCGHRPLRNEAGSCRDCRGSALSAERVAGQIRPLPDNIRVQHGAPGSEVSARPRPCSR